MNRSKMIYWVSTGMLCLMMVASATMYLVDTPQVSSIFASLGFPTYLITPLAILKLLGVLAILTKFSRFLKNLAYAGFFFDFLIAASAHTNAGDGQVMVALVALALLAVSYVYDRKLYSDRR